MLSVCSKCLREGEGEKEREREREGEREQDKNSWKGRALYIDVYQ